MKNMYYINGTTTRSNDVNNVMGNGAYSSAYDTNTSMPELGEVVM